MVREEVKSALVDAIQFGLILSKQNRQDRGLSINNNPWNENLNHIFDLVLKLNGKYELVCFKFNRSGYSLVAVYDKVSKTLFSILSENNLNSLLHKKIEDRIHYSHSFSQLSKEPIKCQQLKFDNIIPNDSKKISDINDLLEKLTDEFEYKNQVERYCVLQTRINHKESLLFSVNAVYLTKNYNISETDNSWAKYISSNYNDETAGNTFIEIVENEQDDNEPISDLSIKDNISLKDKKEENGN